MGRTVPSLLVCLLLVLPLVPHQLPSLGPAVPGPSVGVAAALPTPTTPPPPSAPSSVVDGATLVATVPGKSQPTMATWDAGNGYLYVPNFGAPNLGGNTVSIVDDVNNTPLATVPVGDDPIAATYDPSDGFVYVLNFGSTHNVSIFNGTSIIASVVVGFGPESAVYDPWNGFVYVSDDVSGNVSVLNGTRLLGAVPVGTTPLHAAYDDRNHFVYVPNGGSANVSVLNGTTVVANINVGSTPLFATYDPANGWVYVPDQGSNNVTVINGTSVVANVPTGASPTSSVFDAHDLEVYVTDQGSASVTVVNGTTAAANVSVGSFPERAEYDPATFCVLTTNWGTADSTVINGSRVVATVDVGPNPRSDTYDPDNRAVYVANFNGNNLSEIGTPVGSYDVAVSEVGLPSGSSWGIHTNATTYPTTGSKLAFPDPNGTFGYAVPSVPGYAPIVGQGNFTVAGSSVAWTVTFQAAYDVNFTESGLPSGTNWSVSFDSTTQTSLGPSLDFWVSNGSYAYEVLPVPGFATNWSGTVGVAGGPTAVAVSFSPYRFPVVFRETGLPAGIVWSVSIGGQTNRSTGPSTTLSEPNGTYKFVVGPVPGYVALNASGQFRLNGSGRTVNLSFAQLFGVEFLEHGLPSGDSWSVRLNATTNRSTPSSIIEFALRNGSYQFSVGTSDPSIVPRPGSGTVNVTGVAEVVPVNLTPPEVNLTYGVTFEETGLAEGSLWEVRLANTTESSTRGSLGFELTNGTYPYTVVAQGYVASPASGELVVSGAASVATPIAVQFRLPGGGVTLYSVVFHETGLVVGTHWSVSFDGRVNQSYGPSIGFAVGNGSYSYMLGDVAGYSAQAPEAVRVAGASVVVPVPFGPFVYPVVFQASGLPVGDTWSVVLGGRELNSSRGSLVFEEPNGSYPYSYGTVSGWTAPPAGTVNVSGATPSPIQAQFAPSCCGSASTPIPLWAEGLGAVAVAAVLIAVVRVRRRGSGPVAEPGVPDDPQS